MWHVYDAGPWEAVREPASRAVPFHWLTLTHAVMRFSSRLFRSVHTIFEDGNTAVSHVRSRTETKTANHSFKLLSNFINMQYKAMPKAKKRKKRKLKSCASIQSGLD